MTELLQQYVSRHALENPQREAVVCGDRVLTYGELERRSNRLAHCLRMRGCRAGDRVCLLSPKSELAVVAILAIYKCGAIYVPLDPSSPAPRLAKMIDSAEPAFMVAARGANALADQLLDGRNPIGVFWLEDDLADFPDELPELHRSTDDAAHLLFTSGSTGTPKGVVITHRNVIAFVEWAVRYFGMKADDRVSGHPPLHFDLSMFDLFGTFAAGASLHLVTPDITLFPNKTAQFIRSHALTQWFSVPSLLTYLANMDAVKPGDFPSLRRLLWCGEVLATPSLIYWMRRLPHVAFTNLYGPTEATIASSYYTVTHCPERDTDAIPIGYACDGESLHVLDSNLREVPAGEVGDLYIGGVGLSPGYWRNDAATSAAFVNAAFADGRSERLYRTGDLASAGAHGEIYFRGRADSQIKSRGHRVELGEIESTLAASDNIERCAVVAIPSTHFDGHTICCAYVPIRGRDSGPTLLRSELSRKLPGYMIPSEWLELASLPENANGKVDRPALRTAFQERRLGEKTFSEQTL
ncbi:MAG TPA: amino acid adenylation domain-containing protein [Thermoanaerobaculia bacterium]